MCTHTHKRQLEKLDSKSGARSPDRPAAIDKHSILLTALATWLRFMVKSLCLGS
jgi:hypothetical protein